MRRSVSMVSGPQGLIPFKKGPVIANSDGQHVENLRLRRNRVLILGAVLLGVFFCPIIRPDGEWELVFAGLLRPNVPWLAKLFMLLPGLGGLGLVAAAFLQPRGRGLFLVALFLVHMVVLICARQHFTQMPEDDVGRTLLHNVWLLSVLPLLGAVRAISCAPHSRLALIMGGLFATAAIVALVAPLASDLGSSEYNSPAISFVIHGKIFGVLNSRCLLIMAATILVAALMAGTIWVWKEASFRGKCAGYTTVVIAAGMILTCLWGILGEQRSDNSFLFFVLRIVPQIMAFLLMLSMGVTDLILGGPAISLRRAGTRRFGLDEQGGS